MERKQLLLRFDEDVHDGIRKLAEDSGISVNQLMQGIARWAIKNGHGGEEVERDDHWDLITRPQQGCLWFGQDVTEVTDAEGHPRMLPPEVYLRLDFTERHVIREEDPQPPMKEKP